ncbi:hypothetical protein Vafri_13886, partial [Volvox africanus]
EPLLLLWRGARQQILIAMTCGCQWLLHRLNVNRNFITVVAADSVSFSFSVLLSPGCCHLAGTQPGMNRRRLRFFYVNYQNRMILWLVAATALRQPVPLQRRLLPR